MQIRPPRDDDFAALAALTSHYIATTVAHFGYDAVSEAELRGTWQRGRNRFPWLVADHDGAVLGYAKSGTWRERAAYGWTAEVTVYVAPDTQRRGTGRALYGSLLDALTQRGFRSAIAGITLPNDASVGLHRAFGFTSVGVVEDAGWKHGKWHAIEFFQKKLATGDAPPSPV
jgi:L-amino acid N-acyltransferase YncA